MEFTIREATHDDAVKVINLLNDVFSAQQRSAGNRDENYFDWKFERSPFNKSILTVCEYDDIIVGFDHLWPWGLKYDGTELLAYSGCDSVVKKEYRGNRILQKMRTYGIELARKRGADLMFNFPNQQSLKTNINYGYKFIGKLNWWVKIINPINTMKIFLGIVNNKDSNKLIATSDILNGVEIDNDFMYDLHERFMEKRLININKTRMYYDYRYKDHPTREYKMLAYENKVAVIYTINNNNGFYEMAVTEVVGDKKYIRKILRLINREARVLNCAFVAMVEDNLLFDNSMWYKGYIKKKEKNMVVLNLSNKVSESIFENKAWNLSASLHDSI